MRYNNVPNESILNQLPDSMLSSFWFYELLRSEDDLYKFMEVYSTNNQINPYYGNPILVLDYFLAHEIGFKLIKILGLIDFKRLLDEKGPLFLNNVLFDTFFNHVNAIKILFDVFNDVFNDVNPYIDKRGILKEAIFVSSSKEDLMVNLMTKLPRYF